MNQVINRILYCALIVTALFYSARGQMDDLRWNNFPGADGDLGTKLSGIRYVFSVLDSRERFLYKNWVNGTIVTGDGEIHPGLRMNYDAFSDELVVINEKTSGMFIIDKSTVSSFTVMTHGEQPDEFRKMRLSDTGEQKEYVQILYSGTADLLCRNRIVEEQTGWYKDKFGKISQSVLVLKKNYFLKRNDGNTQRLIPGRRPVISLIPGKEKLVKRLLRENHIRNYKGDDLPGIIELIDRSNYF